MFCQLLQICKHLFFSLGLWLLIFILIMIIIIITSVDKTLFKLLILLADMFRVRVLHMTIENAWIICPLMLVCHITCGVQRVSYMFHTVCSIHHTIENAVVTDSINACWCAISHVACRKFYACFIHSTIKNAVVTDSINACWCATSHMACRKFYACFIHRTFENA